MNFVAEQIKRRIAQNIEAELQSRGWTADDPERHPDDLETFLAVLRLKNGPLWEQLRAMG